MATTNGLYYPTRAGRSIILDYAVPYKNVGDLRKLAGAKNGIERLWSYELCRPCIDYIKNTLTKKTVDTIFSDETLKEINTHCSVSLFLHPGVDLIANIAPVYSVAWGKIQQAKFSPDNWKYIIKIEHEVPCKTAGDNYKQKQKFWAVYGHLDETKKTKEWKAGMTVDAGTPLAITDGTVQTAPHLHFEIHTIGSYPVPNWPKARHNEATYGLANKEKNNDTYVNLFNYLLSINSIQTDVKNMVGKGDPTKDLWKHLLGDVDKNNLERSFCELVPTDKISINNKEYTNTALYNRTALQLIQILPQLPKNFVANLTQKGVYPKFVGEVLKPDLPIGYTDPINYLTELSRALNIDIKVPS